MRSAPGPDQGAAEGGRRAAGSPLSARAPQSEEPRLAPPQQPPRAARMGDAIFGEFAPSWTPAEPHAGYCG